MSGRGHRPNRSERVYEALLLVYPKSFRDAYGPQMVQVFGDLCRGERAGLVGLILGNDVLDSPKGERGEQTGASSSHPVRK